MLTGVRIITAGADETRAVGRRIGALAQNGDVILLHGDLGAGKTTLTQGIGEALGIDEVNSPTFVLVAEHHGRLTLYHVDLYRLEGVDDISDLGLDDVLGLSGLTVVEWPERAWAAFPAEHLLIDLTSHDDSREIVLRPFGPRYERLIQEFAAGTNRAAGD